MHCLPSFHDFETKLAKEWHDKGVDIREVTAIITAIGNHDEKTAAAVTPLSAALILADKSDVRRSRVRAHLDSRDFDIHDRENYAAVDSSLSLIHI